MSVLPVVPVRRLLARAAAGAFAVAALLSFTAGTAQADGTGHCTGGRSGSPYSSFSGCGAFAGSAPWTVSVDQYQTYGSVWNPITNTWTIVWLTLPNRVVSCQTLTGYPSAGIPTDFFGSCTLVS